MIPGIMCGSVGCLVQVLLNYSIQNTVEVAFSFVLLPEDPTSSETANIERNQRATPRSVSLFRQVPSFGLLVRSQSVRLPSETGLVGYESSSS